MELLRFEVDVKIFTEKEQENIVEYYNKNGILLCVQCNTKKGDSVFRGQGRLLCNMFCHF